MMIEKGLDAVKRCIDAAVEPVPSDGPEGTDERIKDRIAELARLSNIDYDRKRGDVAKEIGVRKSILDSEVEKARAEQKREADTPPPPDLGELAALSAEIIACPDVLSLFARDISQHIAGEMKTAKLLYLIGTSRLFAADYDLELSQAWKEGK
jgi:hypothetical protein